MEASDPGRPLHVCFVCTGNICRSPMAEVVLEELVSSSSVLAGRVAVSSAGTGAWHVGEGMDDRARGALAARGYRDHGHRARQVDPDTLGTADLVVALDRGHHRQLGRLVPEPDHQLVLLRSFDPTAGGDVDVPDPYYGSADQFDECLALIEAACQGLATALAALVADPPT